MKKNYLVARWLFSLALLTPFANHADSLRALILLKNPKQIVKPKNSKKLQGAYVFGMIPPGNWKLLRTQLEAAAIDRPIDAKTIELLSQILVHWYQENGDMHIRVIVLAEDLNGDGILQLAIIPNKSVDIEAEELYESMEVGEIAEMDLPESSNLLAVVEVDFDDLLEEELAALILEENETIQPPPTEEIVITDFSVEEATIADTSSLPTGRAVILLENSQQLLSPDVTSNLTGAYFVGELHLGDGALLEQALNDIYLNQPIDESTLPALAQLLADWYTERLSREVEIVIPEQSLDQGILQIVIIELGTIDLHIPDPIPYQEIAETAPEPAEELIVEESPVADEQTHEVVLFEQQIDEIELLLEEEGDEIATLDADEEEEEDSLDGSLIAEEPISLEKQEIVSIEESLPEELIVIEPELTFEEESEELTILEEETEADEVAVLEEEEESLLTTLELATTEAEQESAVVEEEASLSFIEQEVEESAIALVAAEIELQERTVAEETSQEELTEPEEVIAQDIIAIELESVEESFEEENEEIALAEEIPSIATVEDPEEAELIAQAEPQESAQSEEEVLEIASAEPEMPIHDEKLEISLPEDSDFALAEEESAASFAVVETDAPESFAMPDSEDEEILVAQENIEETQDVAIENSSSAPIGKALVLINDANRLLSPEEENACEGTCLFGSTPPGDLAMLQQLLETLYIDKPLDEEAVAAIQFALEEWYQLHGAANVSITMPEQSLEQGVLQLVVALSTSEEIADDDIFFAEEEELLAATPEKQGALEEKSDENLFRGIQLLGSTVPEELEELLTELYQGQPLNEQLIHDIERQLSHWMEENGISDVQLTLQGEPTPEGLLLFDACESLAIATKEVEAVAEEIADSSSTVPIGKALILLGSEDHLFETDELDSMEGTSTFGLAPPGNMADLQKILDEIYLDHPLDEQTIQALKLALQEWYEEHDDNTLEVTIPEQALATGALQIILNNESSNQNPLEQRSSLQPRGRTLLLVDSQEHLLPLEEAEKFTGVNTLGLKLPGTFASLQAKLAPVYLGQPLNMETINAVKQAIYQWYEERDHPFVLVTVPPQKVTHGVVQMMILKAKLGEVSVEGNHWFSDSCLKKYVKTQPGEDIDVYTLQSDLNFINRNPFRRVNMLYTAGAQAGMTDVILTVEDRPPYQVYVGTENNGMVGTERNRIVSGFSVGKLFGLDHILNFQYTSAYDYRRFSACSGQYMALLPWGHMINIYGGYSALHANIVTPHNSNVGRSIQSSLRYTIPCHQEPGFMGEVSLGFDFKSTNNTLAFTSAFANYSSIVNVSQLVAEYRLWREWPTRRVEITTQAYWSPGEILPHESNANYNALRPGAVNKWIYGRTTFRYLERLPMGFTFSFWARGQYSSQNLLPSEQMGIGGYSTVRGYDENQLTMDRAFIANIEFRTPAIPVIAMIRKYPVKDGLQFLVFADYGMGNNHNAIGTENILYKDYLFGVGPGVRYTLDPYVSARLDWGIRLHNQTNFFGETSMVHFSTVFSY